MIYKTLIFRDNKEFAHPVPKSTKDYDWGQSEMPLLLMPETTIEGLQKIYPGLDFSLVELKEVELKIK